MKDYDILIQNGHRYINFKNIDEFKTYENIVRSFCIGEDKYSSIKDSKYSQWNTDDGEGKTLEASKIQEELKLNLEWVLKIMESIDE